MNMVYAGIPIYSSLELAGKEVDEFDDDDNNNKS